jgi:putative transposase
MPGFFHSIAATSGASRRFRILTVIDDCCRETLYLIADAGISVARMGRRPDALARIYGKPACIVSDRRGSENDPGDRFPEKRNRVHQPGHPEMDRAERRPLALHRARQAAARHAFTEAFNGSLRDDLLNEQNFDSLDGVRRQLAL